MGASVHLHTSGILPPINPAVPIEQEAKCGPQSRSGRSVEEKISSLSGMKQWLLDCATRSPVMTPSVSANVAVLTRWWTQQIIWSCDIGSPGYLDVFRHPGSVSSVILPLSWVWFWIFCWWLGYDSGHFAGDLGMILDILQVTWIWFWIFCCWLGYDSGYFAGGFGMIPDILLVTWVWFQVFCWLLRYDSGYCDGHGY